MVFHLQILDCGVSPRCFDEGFQSMQMLFSLSFVLLSVTVAS